MTRTLVAMRAAVGIFLLAALHLAVSSVVFRLEPSVAAVPKDASSALAAFELTSPGTEVALSGLYADRFELLDPRLALPTWHQHVRDEAVRLHGATATCPPAPADLEDPLLAKAYEWHRRTCAGGTFDEAIERAPFVHPSGSSYAALAMTRSPNPRKWASGHANAFHVVELPSLEPTILPPAYRALARLSFRAWEALGRGDSVVIDGATLVVSERDALGLGKIRLHSLRDWESFAERYGAGLRQRSSLSSCVLPASPSLCWVGPAERRRSLLVAATIASTIIAVLSASAIVSLWLRERARLARDRIEALRLLTHELRTPVTSLRIDVEPLRAAYDALPADAQEPLLRLSDGVERLHRVVHRSARYLALLEAPQAPRERFVRMAQHSSVADLIAGLAEEWPHEVEVRTCTEDHAICTDSDWLALVLRNLVENAVRHGQPPVTVTWGIETTSLVIRVADGGLTPTFSLRKVAPFQRHRASSGLGLGLSLVMRAARLLGGRLAHEPSPTTFELRIPLSGAT